MCFFIHPGKMVGLWDVTRNDNFHTVKGLFNPFTPDSAKSKIYKFSKITHWVKLKKETVTPW